MAIGMGRMLGFELPQNFNFPYVAQSVTEFWRRWHMTLSQWFRDYLYIPLGGNRISPLRTYINLWVVFLLCGLWHGAAWTFVLWGAYHGAFLVLERAYLSKLLASAPRIIRHIYLPVVVALSWVPFRAETIGGSFDYYRTLFGLGAKENVTMLGDIAADGMVAVFITGLIVALWPLASETATAFSRRTKWRIEFASGGALAAVTQIAAAFLLIVCAGSLAGGGYNPFIYFRF